MVLRGQFINSTFSVFVWFCSVSFYKNITICNSIATTKDYLLIIFIISFSKLKFKFVLRCVMGKDVMNVLLWLCKSAMTEVISPSSFMKIRFGDY